jgi:SAM-dependent methyltransferase
MELFRSYQGFRLADLVDGKRVLHFAPEQVLSKHLETRAARYVTADISRSEVSLQLDLCAMDSVPDGSFDTLIACDVLEHTPDDALAMSEIHRVLDPGGVAVITVPQGDDFQTTYEDPAVNTPEARQREYGQFDHRRIYGADFADRLAQYGFAVSALDASYSQRSRSTRRWPKRGPGRPTPNPRRLPELRSSAQR